jgi:hypothetical protein
MYGCAPVGYSNNEHQRGGNEMDSTHEFVEKLHEKQKKAEQNKKRQDNGSPSEKLPTKRH